MYNVNALPALLDIGITGANRQTEIRIDVSAWQAEYPEAVIAVCVRRPDEDADHAYFGDTAVKDGILTWTIHRADLGTSAGFGKFEVWALRPDHEADDEPLFKSVSVTTRIRQSIAASASQELPEAARPWAQQVLDAAAAAEEAVEHYPTIGENGNWFVWDANAGAFVDTGNPSRGAQESAPLIIETATGDGVVSVTDSAERKFEGLNLFGRTDQEKTTGKNLFYPNWYHTKNEDGTFSITGFSSGATATLTGKIPAGTYTFSYLQGYDKGYLQIGSAENYSIAVAIGGTKTFQYDGQSYLRIVCSNVPADTTATYKIQLESGAVATAFEPYTGGIPSPNPDYPQELESAGASGAIHTTVCGKNLVSVADLYVQNEPGLAEVKQTDSVITLATTRYGDGFCFCVNALKKGKSYVFSGHVENCVNVRIFMSRDDVIANTNFIEVPVDSSGNFNYVHTPAKDGAIFRIWVSDNVCTLTNFQVEEGYTATAYEPYKGQTLTASTPNGLPGIPVESGGNYTDENGQQWICDEIDFARGVYVQRTEKYVLNGGTNEVWTNRDGYFIASRISAVDIHDKWIRTVNPASMANVGVSSYAILDNGGYGFAAAYGFRIRFENMNPDTNTEVDLRAYLAANPITAIVALATPIETPLFAAELSAYAALQSQYPNTTVVSDANCGIQIAYVADTKKYIDKKFAELSAAP